MYAAMAPPINERRYNAPNHIGTRPAIAAQAAPMTSPQAARNNRRMRANKGSLSFVGLGLRPLKERRKSHNPGRLDFPIAKPREGVT
ncbi:hypothetical protein K227x_61870 [Rubripirellula lacrimiformis]|uniref:Uncharacterized protein n=1 Tax=Rubripirellula lacrimiformis TaxID=1930273 RepID=A0A517NL12_9BACT|nr:hypothetical protein K227x_61870 [Rubripirellula lacrimiformis]